MDNIKNSPRLILALNLLALIGCIVLLTHNYIKTGLSASWLWLLLITISLIVYLFSLFNRQHKQPIQVIKALANGDSTLGLSANHPMRQYFEKVKQQMQLARFNAEQQAQFLQALLVHVDIAVLVCDAQGKIIESNPAVAKLLGKSVLNFSELAHIGTLVLTTKRNIRSTVQWLVGEQQDTLSIHISIAEIQGQVRKIVTLHSIHDVLLNKEQQAYKRLTEVLTHEVANSVTPLASIAQTCQGLIPEGLNFTEEESKQDLCLALKTIESRTQYLGEFIEGFRQISRLPKPNLMPAKLAPILERVVILNQQQLTQYNITLTLSINNQHLVMIDSVQVEQVLINLVKNAIEAVQSYADNTEQGKITLSVAQNNSQQLYVEVADNGAGIAEHVIDMIFVPFFTTKQQGSGIGLSLSKQIMISHGGDLIYVSRTQGACFRCVFG
jgi:nitrogen fixation/metabolism regulation signal transduction histidine kinase